MVQALARPCDAWFLDGMTQEKPSIWRRSSFGDRRENSGRRVLRHVYRCRAVRRGLIAAGFAVEQCPGFGGKKSVLRGTKQ